MRTQACQRHVTLQVGDETWLPRRFFCMIQFHLVPSGDYLLTVYDVEDCTESCDVERCQVVAWEDQVAVEPVAGGRCPLEVIDSGR